MTYETKNNLSPANSSAEDLFSGLFNVSDSGTGEEELLRIASQYSRQMDSRQIRSLCRLKAFSIKCEPKIKEQIDVFVDYWINLKQYNRSNSYIMYALDSISLRKFINENTMKVNVMK